VRTLTNDASVAAGTIIGSGSTLGIGTLATGASVTNGLERALTFSNTNTAAGTVNRVGDEIRIGTTVSASFGTNNIVWLEIPTGVNNGVNTNFYTASAVVGGNWLKVYRNGLVMARTTDFVYVASNHFRFVPAAYASNDTIQVDYIK
jgi:hypothetical protein